MSNVLKERNANYNYPERFAQIYCFFILCIFPLCVDKTGFAAVTIFKFRLFAVSACILFLFAVGTAVYWAFDKSGTYRLRQNDFKLSVTLPQIFATLYVVWSLVSALCSAFGKDTIMGQGRHEGLFSAFLYSSVFVILSFWCEYSRWFTRGMTVMVIIFDIVSVMQLFYPHIILPETYWESGIFIGTIGNVDVVAGLVAISVPVLFLSYVIDKDEAYWSEVGLVAMFFLLAIFSLTDVDSGKIGLLAALICAVPFIFDTPEHLSRSCTCFSVVCGAFFLRRFLGLAKDGFHLSMGKTTTLLLLISAIFAILSYLIETSSFSFRIPKKYILIALAVVIIIACCFLFAYDGNNRLMREMSEILHFKLSDDAGTERGYIWKVSMWLAGKKPFAGYGPGVFYDVFKYFDKKETKTDFAHNDFVQITVCTGYVGLAIYLAFIISLAVRVIKNAEKFPMIVVFGIACIGYLVHSFFSFSIAIITPLFWAMAGLCDKIARQCEK